MKKWLLTFCAFGFITTQGATADASINKEEIKDSSIQRIVKMIKADQVENEFTDFINNMMGNNKSSLKAFSTNLLVKKLNLEKAVKTTENEKIVNKPIEKTTVASKNKEAKQQKPVKKEAVKESTKTAPEKQKVTEPSSNQVPKTNVETTTIPSTSTNNQPVDSNKTTQPSQTAPTQSTTSAVSNFESQVVELTNVERAKYGLAPLKSYQPLMTTAHAKSDDMARNNYFSHTSPTYGSPFDQIKAAGISYRAAGENIAQGQRTPEEVVQAWMNSSGHRANILNANFTHIGVGYVSNGNYWTQQFAQM